MTPQATPQGRPQDATPLEETPRGRGRTHQDLPSPDGFGGQVQLLLIVTPINRRNEDAGRVLIVLLAALALGEKVVTAVHAQDE